MIEDTERTDCCDQVRHWLTAYALPLWATTGIDTACGGFVERLTWSGTPDVAATKRIRVQARQIYVFSHASLLGLHPDGAAIASRGYDFLMRHACPDGVVGGFVHALDRQGKIVDPRRNSYDHAFLLLAFSWFYRATRRDDVLAAIYGVLAAIDARLALADGSGVAVDDALGPDRLQNPHMHLLEAMLAAAEATGRQQFLDRADQLEVLFRTRMFDAEWGILREFYDAGWRPAAGERGRIVEPGHHYEWVWLLKRHADAHCRPLSEEAWRLADFIDRHGRPASDVLLCDELWDDGSVKSAAIRTWPQTEALKGEVALAEARGIPLPPRAEAIVDALFDRFLDRPIAGGWTDRIGADGAALVDTIPASSLYHLFLAFSEYLKAAEPAWPSSNG